MKLIRTIDIEVLIWVAGLGLLALVDPNEQQHFSFCLFKNLGINVCPGCGLGRSISYFFHGDVVHSFRTHPLGIAAVTLLSVRTASLIRKSITSICVLRKI